MCIRIFSESFFFCSQSILRKQHYKYTQTHAQNFLTPSKLKESEKTKTAQQQLRINFSVLHYCVLWRVNHCVNFFLRTNVRFRSHLKQLIHITAQKYKSNPPSPITPSFIKPLSPTPIPPFSYEPEHGIKVQ